MITIYYKYIPFNNHILDETSKLDTIPNRVEDNATIHYNVNFLLMLVKSEVS